MVGWLYTNSLVFFLSPFAMCYDNEVLFMHKLSFWKRKSLEHVTLPLGQVHFVLFFI